MQRIATLAASLPLALALAATLTGATTVRADEPKLIFEDKFDAKPDADWRWLRENPQRWRINDGALEIRAEPGLADTVKNALLRKAPDRASGTYAIEVTVTNTTPATQQYEQVGITWYVAGKPVFKLVHERIDGAMYIIPGKKPSSAKTMQLRLIVSKDRFVAQYRPDGKGEFQTAATGPLPPPNGDEVSLQCYHGPADADHWMRFDDFRIYEMPK
jgi:hypothetical protein